MCRTFEEIRNEGFARGIEQGIEQGRAQGMEQGQLASIRSLMETMKITAQQAMDAMKIPVEDQNHFTALLQVK